MTEIDITGIEIGTKLVGDRAHGRTSVATVTGTLSDKYDRAGNKTTPGQITALVVTVDDDGEEFTVIRVDSADSTAIGWRLLK